MEASIHSANKATPDTLTTLAREIWHEVRALPEAKTDDDLRTQLEDLQTRYHDFAMSFPLPLRLMVQARRFSADAFRKWLLRRGDAKCATREDFLDLQAEYAVDVYRAEHPRAPHAAVCAYRDSVRDGLRNEDEAFIEATEEINAEEAERAALRSAEIRLELREMLIARRNGGGPS